jgi:uncharacterized protein
MIRLTELKLPLAHTDADLEQLVLQTLSLTASGMRRMTIFKRSIDARKAQLQFVYVVDVELADPSAEPSTVTCTSARVRTWTTG